MSLAVQIPGLGPEQSTIVIALFAVVIVGSIIALVVAFTIRGRRTRRFRAGAGDPSVPAPTDPWRRFAAALGAPYARVDITQTRGARRRHTPEQLFFGFASALPFPMAASQLQRDWGVKSEQTAEARCVHAVGQTLKRTRELLLADPTRDIAALRGRLQAAGAPDDFTHEVLDVGDDERAPGDADALRDALVFDIARFAALVRWSAQRATSERILPANPDASALSGAPHSALGRVPRG